MMVAPVVAVAAASVVAEGCAVEACEEIAVASDVVAQ